MVVIGILASDRRVWKFRDCGCKALLFRIKMCVNRDGTTGPAADRRGIDLNRLVEDAPKAVFFFATQAVLPAIISQKRGVIVSLASMAGKIGSWANP